MPKEDKKLLTISELAKTTGFSQRMIHLHEERGLITSIRHQEGGNRYFSQEAIYRLNKVKQLQAIGLKLPEIAEVLPLYMDKSDKGIKGKKAALKILEGHLNNADKEISSLNLLREDIIKSIARLELLLEQYQAELKE